LDNTDKQDIHAFETKLRTNPAVLIDEVENYLKIFGSIPPSQGLQQQIMAALEYYQTNFGELPPLAENELKKYLDLENNRLFPMNGGKSRKGRNNKKSRKSKTKKSKTKKSKTKKSKTKKNNKSRKN
jgi:hypothetical protein